MNKTEMAKVIAERMSVNVAESQKFINVLQEVCMEELRQEGYIIWQGFGVFAPWVQTRRMGRNPQTGQPCIIPPRISVKFKPGRTFLRTLNDRKM